MLLALKQNTAAVYSVRLIAIRERELDLTVLQANSCATVFALLAGIMADSMWTGYYMYELVEPGGAGAHGEGLHLELLAALSIYASIFVPLLGLWHCMLLTLLGPRLALHGPQAAFGQTVDAIRHEFLHALELLGLSVASIFGTVATWSWATQHQPTAVLICAAGAACCAAVAVVVRTSCRRFHVARDELVTGSFADDDRSDGGVRRWGGAAADGAGYRRLDDEGAETEPEAPPTPPRSPAKASVASLRARLVPRSAASGEAATTHVKRSRSLKALADASAAAGADAPIGLSVEEAEQLRRVQTLLEREAAQEEAGEEVGLDRQSRGDT